MKIDEIYVIATRNDIRFARVCICSIRYFYPQIPIKLLIDEIFGKAETTDLEAALGVTVVETPQRIWGWGFAKFFPMLLEPSRRVLILDSDIIFTHPLLERLEQYDEDFIVATEPEWPDYEDYIRRAYFVPDAMADFDPGFQRQLTFNGGQMVVQTGKLTRKDFEQCVEFVEPIRVKRADVFPCGEQGVTNYLVNAKLAEGSVSVRSVDYMLWADSKLVPKGLPTNGNDTPLDERMLAHYTCHKKIYPWKMKSRELFYAFENRYYALVKHGWLLSKLRAWETVYCHHQPTLKTRIKDLLTSLKN